MNPSLLTLSLKAKDLGGLVRQDVRQQIAQSTHAWTVVGQNSRGRPWTVWKDVVLSDIHKLKLSCYTRDALNKAVWRELSYVAYLMPAG